MHAILDIQVKNFTLLLNSIGLLEQMEESIVLDLVQGLTFCGITRLLVHYYSLEAILELIMLHFWLF